MTTPDFKARTKALEDLNEADGDLLLALARAENAKSAHEAETLELRQKLEELDQRFRSEFGVARSEIQKAKDRRDRCEMRLRKLIEPGGES